MLNFSLGNMSGVKNKINNMAKEFSEVNIKYVVFNRVNHGEVDGVEYIDVTRLFGFLTPFLFRAFKFIPIYLWFKKKNNVGTIILRYPLADISSLFMPQNFFRKVITEHHTKELEEIKEYNLPKVYKSIQYWMEKHMARFAFRNVKSIIAVTDDILDYQKQRFGKKDINGYVFSNGIDVSKYNFKKFQHGVNIQTRIVFVASRFCPWHGLDRVLKSLESWSPNGSRRISLVLIGQIDNDIFLNNPDIDLEVHGLLPIDKVNKIIDSCDFAIDSMALD